MELDLGPLASMDFIRYWGVVLYHRISSYGGLVTTYTRTTLIFALKDSSAPHPVRFCNDDGWDWTTTDYAYLVYRTDDSGSSVSMYTIPMHNILCVMTFAEDVEEKEDDNG